MWSSAPNAKNHAEIEADQSAFEKYNEEENNKQLGEETPNFKAETSKTGTDQLLVQNHKKPLNSEDAESKDKKETANHRGPPGRDKQIVAKKHDSDNVLSRSCLYGAPSSKPNDLVYINDQYFDAIKTNLD